MSHWLGLAFAVLTAAGCAYALLAAALVLRFGRGAELNSTDPWPSVTILKPLHGLDPGLRENLLSFCDQDYRGQRQVVFGVQSPEDPAIPVVRGIIEERSDLDLDLVVSAQQHGSNPKIANLINMESAAKHEVIVIADSDMRVERSYLSALVPLLQEPSVGAVTCAYDGQSGLGVWSRLADLGIHAHFLPGVIVGLFLGMAQPCFGSTIALRRETLHLIGGFRRFRDALADDYALGEAVRNRGSRVAVAPFLVAHRGNTTGLADLMRQELRWAKTIFVVNRAGFIGTGVTHAFPLSLMACAFLGGAGGALWLIAIAVACRFALLASVSRRFNLTRASLWLLPLRDLMSFVIYIACFMARDVHWRGQDFLIAPDGTMELRKESR
jgi:ceramide glucosyltransferase